MTIGAIVEELIYLKRKYNINYPDDNTINNACNILDRLQAQENVDKWIETHSK